MAQIKTFARLKPTKKPYNGYVISKNVLTMHIPDNKDFVIMGPQNNLRSNFSYDILFTNIFGCDATQEEVFDGVAKDIIQNFLNGYNGTIFAYGQTGTGKTYTVEGNTNRYNARGLATRALSMIYQELEKRSDQHISVYLSYLEIYQEVAYDLLNPAARSTIPIAPFARVTVVEGPRGSCILRGLSLHLAANEEIAQMLLLQGQANRKVAETPVNQRSSRSHAVFTVYLQVRKHDSDVLVNSKLHLVDLAGSERVSKTGVDGQQLTEAKSINLSLHHLETVIIALQLDKPPTSAVSKGENPPQQSRSNSSLMSSGPSSDNGGSRQLRFVPYRNSLLTMVLKDSLGGNCLTAMIATISLEPENLGESISTCRFAQRVARIANNARRNEEVDDKALIKRLKNKVAYLENQVALLGSKGRSDPLTEEEIMDVLTDEDQRICERIMEGFLQGVITDPIEAGISDQCRFRACLHLLKHQFLRHRSLTSSAAPGGFSTSSAVGLPGSSGAAGIPGSSCSTSTLLPQANHSHADMMCAGQANNPQQDSGDFATVGQGFHQAPGSLSAEDPKRSEGLVDSREKESYDSYNVRNSKPLIESSPGIKAARIDIGEGQQAQVFSAEDEEMEQRKNGSAKAKAKKAGGCGNLSGIDEVLQACSGGGGAGSGGPGEQRYKSPYERRREKEIRRLSRKLTEMEEDKAGRESQLQQMKEQAIVEELLVAETGLRLKLQVAEEQVADQHAYLLQLKHLQADPDLITKEQLVEKQLRKRQTKFHEKLTKVLASKDTLEQDFAQRRSAAAAAAAATAMDGAHFQHHHDQLQQQPGAGSRESSSKTSLEERFGQYKQGKGSLNTRQVFDLLKNQEKKQQKESQKVERETTMVKTKQLAIKEAATLEKLRELKQMLKLSLLKEEQQQNQLHGQGLQEAEAATAAAVAGQNFSSSCQVGDSGARSLDSQGQHAGSTVQHRGGPPVGGQYGHSSTQSSSRPGGPQHHQAWAGSSRDQNQSQHCSVGGGMTQEQTSSVHQFMMEMLGNTDGDTYPFLDGERVPASGQKQYDNHHQMSFSHANHVLNGSAADYRAVPGNRGFAGEPGPRQTGEAPPPQPAIASQSLHDPRHSFKFFHENSHEQHGPTLSGARDTGLALSDKPERFLHSKARSRAGAPRSDANANNAAGIGMDGPVDEELLISDLETAPPGEGPGGHGRAGKNPQASAYGDVPVMMPPAKSDQQSVPLSSSASAQQRPPAGPVVPPSEYINSMSSQDKFDARRMGLSSRTFESALSHMLESGRAIGRDTPAAVRNVPDLPYTVNPYQEFSRSSRAPPHTGGPPPPPRNLSQSAQQSPYLQRNPRQRSPPHKPGLSSSASQETTRKVGASSGQASRTGGADLSTAWGPESKNASVAERLANFLDTPSSFLPAQNDTTNGGTSGKNQNAQSTKALDLDPFEAKLAKFKGEMYSNHSSSSSEDADAKADNNNDEDEEDRSFFGMQPAETKLTSLTAEEGEKTFMSTVAAEKARVEKIRRARNAAEVIQRRWRRFRARQ